ncbi:signal peptidase I [Pseudogemmobacter faecipullorum]|uniref:Signal peptidase I n=1 Tax=Pseudogemmobacter faecipullorum TaxID=2755041 RepID=A0ABS8CGW9_9RHOB|nr:signal peptidase I [Pseudogemmobacter faecipullorum]MCB5408626.1 signal peptidase I [Pseudogemmobacter faecipullorum]
MARAKPKSALHETISTVVWALVIALGFRTLFFQPFWIPSESMKSSLLIGDFLFVNKMAYGYSRYSCPFAVCPIEGRIFGSDPERGDVVVFRHPTSGDDYIKRVIGLPGDTVQMKEGRVILNGQELVQQPDGIFAETYEPQGPMKSLPRCGNGVVGLGASCERSRSIETIPTGEGDKTRSYPVLNIADSTGLPDNSEIFTVPEGHFFFMGDNRDNSMDSRFRQGAQGGVGMVSADLLIGRADRVIFSAAGSRLWYFWTWRMDRFFHGIE